PGASPPGAPGSIRSPFGRAGRGRAAAGVRAARTAGRRRTARAAPRDAPGSSDRAQRPIESDLKPIAPTSRACYHYVQVEISDSQTNAAPHIDDVGLSVLITRSSR